MFVRFFWTALMMGILNLASAQNTLCGTITDQSDQPLPGTSIFFPGLNKGTIAGREGGYEIGNIPNGKIKIQFSFVGYHTQIVTIDAIDSIIILNIKLHEVPIEAQEIVITGGYISAQHDNAVKIDVLKREPIYRSGSSNFMEAVTRIPGVDMIARGQGIVKPVIRGLSMNNVLVLNNSIRIENYQYGENHPLGVDGNHVGKVEVIKGPASLLYGSDAIGGVINFISEQPAPVGQLKGDYMAKMYSNTNGINHGLGIKGATKNLFGEMRVGQRSHCDYIQGGGEFVPNSRFNEHAISLNMGYSGRIGTIKLFYDYLYQNLGMTTAQSVQLVNNRSRKNELWFQDLNHQLVSLQNKLFFVKTVWEFNLGYQHALRKLQTVFEIPDIEMQLNTLTLDSKFYLLNEEDKEIIIGIQGMNQHNRNQNDQKIKLLADADINTLGFFGVVQHTFFYKLKVQGGLRYDIYGIKSFATGIEGEPGYKKPITNNFQSLNGSLGATYHFNNKLLFRSNLAKAFRAPNLAELTSNGIHAGRYEIGNENLNPQEAIEIDLSIHLHTDNITFDIAAFSNLITDYIYIKPTNDTTQDGESIFRFSQLNANLYGGEAGLHVHPNILPWLHLQVTYSHLIGKQQNGENLPLIPAKKFRYEVRAEWKQLGFMHNPSIQLSAITALPQQKISPLESPTKSYRVFSASLNTEFKVGNQYWNFGLGMNNIFDIQYFDHLSTLKQLGFFNQGREMSIRLRIPFDIVKIE